MNLDRMVEDVAETLRMARSRGKACTLLIGAGCSVKAGIPLAQEFVEVIRDRYPRAYERAKEKAYPYCMSELSPDEQRDLLAEFIDKAKMNWAHIGIAQLMKEGYIDRVLTTNFDPLVIRACSMVGLYPAVYDLAASKLYNPEWIPDHAVLYLHGQRTGFALKNTDEDFKRHAEVLTPVFSDVGKRRVWLVVGYSGSHDPVFEQLAAVEYFPNRLYWVGFRDIPPPAHVREKILTGRNFAFHVPGYDADDFFVTLCQRLGAFPPKFIGTPFSYLQSMLNTIAPYIPPTQRITTPGDGPAPPTAAIDIGMKTRELLQEAIKKYERQEEQAEDGLDAVKAALLADSLIVGGKYSEVVSLVERFGEPVPETLREPLESAVAAQASEIVSRAEQTKDKAEALKMLKDAIAYYEQSCKKLGPTAELLTGWGYTLNAIARDTEPPNALELWDEAILKFQEAEKLDSEDPYINDHWGYARLFQSIETQDPSKQEGYLLQAKEQFEKAVQKDSENLGFYEDLAGVLQDLEKISKGKQKTKYKAEFQNVKLLMDAKRFSAGENKPQG